MRQCEVYLHDIRAGLLTEEDNGEYVFAYEPSYVADKMPPVSPTLPLREEPYRSPYLFPVFFNMLSEGENRRIQSRPLHIDSGDDFGILLATAQNDTVGAITVKPIEP
ncbi:MAG TPA: HipA N-terminal domain-containing protein [Candidatus Coprenecus stercoravium]|uniref:HipA N-terminal domain-containing protein n=1 Tax=Candidatus Coprenecus stercoravium TaxID=2840735 RepID=A0A9D2GQW5_9BACT|nr:HipA N-terminal domain-containing protein [Candidatus Coprenecus stercoravium]